MNPADLTLSISPSLTNRALSQSATAASLALAAAQRARTALPRVDLEPLYVQIKAALGDHWADYKLALNQFVLGHLNQAELVWVLQPLLSPATATGVTVNNSVVQPTPSILHLHNALITAIYANTLRDPPPSEVAPWVVANDKPTSAAKNAGASGANDKAEERLKKEVMAMPARDRRRVKAVKESAKPVNDGFADIHSYRAELAGRAPDSSSTGASGTRTNWDLESRRRYAQPLAHETLEFPSQNDLQNRIEPLCYEEGISNGVAQGVLPACAELLEQATEVYLKELLGAICAHSRSNAESCIQTSRFRRQLRREEADAERGTIQRSAAGLLPVELDAQAKRAPLHFDDLRLSLNLHDSFIRHDPFLAAPLTYTRHPSPPPPPNKQLANGIASHAETAHMNGVAMNITPEWSWHGGTKGDVDDLLGTLDECLAVG